MSNYIRDYDTLKAAVLSHSSNCFVISNASSVFFSGDQGGNYLKARAFLFGKAAFGTIDDSVAGKEIFSSAEYKNLEANFQTSREAGIAKNRIDRMASRRFAEAASGDVWAFVRNANLRRVFCAVELPVLMENPRVLSINGIPKEELKQVMQREGIWQVIAKITAKQPAMEPALVDRHPTEKIQRFSFATFIGNTNGSVSVNSALFGLPGVFSAFRGYRQKRMKSSQATATQAIASSASGLASGSKRTSFLSKLREQLGKTTPSNDKVRTMIRPSATLSKPKALYKAEASKELQRLRSSNAIKLDAASRMQAKQDAQKVTKAAPKATRQDQKKAASPPPPKRKQRSTLRDNRPQNKQADVRRDKVRHTAQQTPSNTHPSSSKPANNSSLHKGAAQSSPTGDKKQGHDVKQQPSQAPKPASPNQITSSNKQQPPVQPAASSADKKTEQPKQPAASAAVPAPNSKVTAKPTEQTPTAAQAKQNNPPLANTTKPAEAAKPSPPAAKTESQTKSAVTTEGPKPAAAATTPQQKPASHAPVPKATETPKTAQNITTANQQPKGPPPTAPKQVSAAAQPSPTPSQQATATPKATTATQKAEQAPAATKTATASPSPSPSPNVATAGPKPAPATPPPNQVKPLPAQQTVAAAAPPRNVSPPPPRPRRVPPPPPPPPPPPRRSR